MFAKDKLFPSIDEEDEEHDSEVDSAEDESEAVASSKASDAREEGIQNSDTDIDEEENEHYLDLNFVTEHLKEALVSESSVSPQEREFSDGSSGRSTVPKIRSPPRLAHLHKPPPSECDSDESSGEKKKRAIPGEYDPQEYEDLHVNDDIKAIFTYIHKYIPQVFNLDNKYQPFIPDYLPAVGDSDAFLKVLAPDVNLAGQRYESSHTQQQLGVTVLDEPAAGQSDTAVLYLQLKAADVHVSNVANCVVKKVENVERDTKVVDKWIKDVMDLRRSESSAIVKYTNPMPELEDLMQEWPNGMEKLLTLNGLPSCHLNCSLSFYIELMCCIFNIPVYESKVQSLHVLFSLFAVIKNSQLYQLAKEEMDFDKCKNLDQLVID